MDDVAYWIKGPFFIGPLNEGQMRNTMYIGEGRVRYNLYRYFILRERDF